MISGFGWAALALLFGYLALFFWGLVEAISRLGRRFEARVTKHLIERT